MVTFDVSLLRQRSPEKHISLIAYKVQVESTDTDPTKRLEDAARSHINERFAPQGVTTIEHFLDLEQPRKTALERMELAHRVARERSLGSEKFPPFVGEVAGDVCGAEGTKKSTTHHLIAIFAISPMAFNLKVRGVIKSSNKVEFSFEGTVKAPPDDTAQVIHGIALRYIDQDDTLSVESGSGRLYGMDEDEYKMVSDSGTGRLGRRTDTLYESTTKVSTMKPNLVFEAMLIRHLQIPYAVFHHQSDSYRFLCQNRADATSEDTVKDLHEAIRESIRNIPAWKRETLYEIDVYEPKEAFQSAYNKLPDELEDLELDHESFRGKMCSSFLPRNRLSCWREGQTLIAVFSTPDQSQPSEASFMDRFSRLRIATETPSFIAKSGPYKSLQNSAKERIQDDRPQQDKLIAPISLLYQPFGYFHDVRCGEKIKIDGHDNIKDEALMIRVNALADTMSSFFNSEEERRSSFVEHLEQILGIEPNSINSSKIPGGQKTSDGHKSGPHGAIVLCVECKNELSSASCEPIPQLTSYIATSFASRIKHHKNLFERWRIPALGVTLVGPTVQFFGAVPTGQMRVVPLTPPLPMVDPAGERFRWDLFLAFKAAALVFSKIQFDIKKYLQVLDGPHASWPPIITEERSCFPSATEIATPPDPDRQAGKTKFVLKRRRDQSEHRHLYEATIVSPTGDQKNPIYVKFSQRYSVELHQFCASKGHAPKILGFDKLSGGWFMVAMEKIEAVDWEEIRSPPNVKKWEEEIRGLVDGFHEIGLVHGDLRLANFVFPKDLQKMQLVDFDWGGKDGEVTFPYNVLTPELGAPDDGFLDRIITKDHDKRCLEKVLERVRGLGENFERSEQGMEM